MTGPRVPLGEWTPDCGGAYCLSGSGYFANYWPDNTVSASIYLGDDEQPTEVATSGIVARPSKAACQAFAEEWIAERLAQMASALSIN